MATFSICIAGYTATVESLFDSTRDYCRKYLSDDAPDFYITVTREDLLFEQQALDAEADAEGLRRRVFTDPFLERAAIQRQMAEQLLPRGVLLFHGSAVAADGKGYIFSAPCGTGKSTHARLWLQLLGDRARYINDDKPFIRLEEGAVSVCGAPWSGKHGLENNVCVPLQGICILRRGTQNTIAPAEPQAVMDFLAHQCLLPRQEADMACFNRLVQQLAGTVPLFDLSCTPTLEAAQVAFDAMAGR